MNAAAGKTVPDILAPGLKVLFCGINPGLYTAAVGHHFARPGNRFWPALYLAGITPRLLQPDEERELLKWGYGITNVVARASAVASDLNLDELKAGGMLLEQKVKQVNPRILAVLGIGAYRSAFSEPKAMVGEQSRKIGTTRVWALPNPSGLNAHYNVEELAALLRELKQAAEADSPEAH